MKRKIPICLWNNLLGAFEKLRKATVSFVTSVYPRGKILPPLEEFSWNSNWVFLENLSRKFKYDWNVTVMDTSTWRFVYVYDNTCWILLRMRNVFEKSYRESQNTHFVFNNSPLPPLHAHPHAHPRKSCRLWENVEKVWESQTEHRWQRNTTQKNGICMPDNSRQPRQVWETGTEGTRVRRRLRVGWKEHMWKLMRKKREDVAGATRLAKNRKKFRIWLRQEYRQTLIIFNTYCFSTATIFTRTATLLRLYVHRLSSMYLRQAL